MDRVDFQVYRYLSPGGEARFWAGRRVIDPDVPARAIAAHVGISENAVRSRLRGLGEKGFLRGTSVTPNPELLGARVFVTEIPIRTPTEAERLLHDLALVEGVVFARDTLDEGERRVRVHFVSDRDTTTARRTALLRRLSPAGDPPAPQPYALPSCEREMTTLDWRLLDALIRRPDASVPEIAKEVRVSLKTAARRRHELIDDRACWWTHGPESEEFPLALVRVNLEDGADRDSVSERAFVSAAAWMPVARDGLGLGPEDARSVVAALVPADAPTVLERMVREISGLEGVAQVQRTFPLGSMSYPAWFAERVSEHVPRRGR
jgi:DNA-binding Lrp family transcriptional regulator